MIFLPKGLARLSDLVGDSSRYAMGGVCLSSEPDGSFTAVATDGRRMGVIRGPNTYHGYTGAQLTAAGASDVSKVVIVPGKAWKDAFKGASPTSPVGIAMMPKHTETSSEGLAIATGDTLTKVLAIEGRFPRWQDVIPKRSGVRVTLSATMLKSLCLVVEALNKGTPHITIQVIDGNNPVLFTATGEGGLTFEGLIMPLSENK